ncbi:MAG: hypothetical protein WAL02_04590, partial [Rhodoplanes sp.]
FNRSLYPRAFSMTRPLPFLARYERLEQIPFQQNRNSLSVFGSHDLRRAMMLRREMSRAFFRRSGNRFAAENATTKG